MDDLLKQMFDDLKNASAIKDEVVSKSIQMKISKYQKSKEWCQIINLPEFNSIIENLISRLVEKGITLMLWKNSKISKHQRAPIGDKFVYCICVKEICINKKEIIYDILHELGHALDKEIVSNEELKNNSLKCQKREITAWLLADEEFLKISELQEYFEEYEEYKWLCLKSYGISKIY